MHRVDIDAVLFDLDDTLLDGAAAWRSGMERLMLRCPQVDEDACFEAWDSAFQEHYPRYLAGELSFEESRIARIRSWSARLSIGVEEGDELAWFADYLVGYEEGWTAFADVHGAIAALEGFLLGVVTNGEGAQQRAKLAALGLTDHFEVVVAAGDVGVAKPDRRIFHLAAERLGVAVSRCLFVGDQRDVDSLGAMRAGMSALWLNRNGERAPEDGLVMEIASLSGLARAVRALGE